MNAIGTHMYRILGFMLLALATVAGAQSLGWKKITGTANDIGVGPDGSVWVISSDKGIYRWHPKASWQKVPGEAARIDVGPDGPWVVNEFGSIYRWNGSNWTLVPGAGTDIGVGANGAVWLIAKSAHVPGGREVYRFNGKGGWDKMPGGGVRIDVDPGGNAWVVTDEGDVYRWTGSAWEKTPGGGAADIGIGGDGSVFAAGKNGKVWKWTGSGWKERDGVAASISVDPQGRPWATAPDKSIWSAGNK